MAGSYCVVLGVGQFKGQVAIRLSACQPFSVNLHELTARRRPINLNSSLRKEIPWRGRFLYPRQKRG